jgi:molybdate transport system substrate-binding protein
MLPNDPRHRRVLSGITILLAIAASALAAAAAKSAEIKVFSDGPLRPALERVAEGFERESGHKVALVFDLSPAIHRRVTGGEAGDVLIIQPNFIDELQKAGNIVAGENPIIGQVNIGLSARADATPLDLSTTENFKRALLGADAIVFNNVASGNAFAEILGRLGLMDALKDKIVRLPPAAVDARIISGNGHEIGVGPVPLIMVTKGLKLVGSLPAELQRPISYSAALMTSARQADAAKAFIGYMGTPQGKAALNAAGVD